MMTGPVFVNGRFLSQPVTGVQRFSAEIVGAIDTLMGRGEWPETSLLAPPRDGEQPSRPDRAPPGGCGSASSVGGMAIFGSRSICPGGSWRRPGEPGQYGAPPGGRGQVVVIHDAGVFDTPASYSWKFRLWYKGLQRALAKAGAQIATVSEFSRQRIAARLGLDPARISVIYEGADHILRTPADPQTLMRHNLRAVSSRSSWAAALPTRISLASRGSHRPWSVEAW